MDGRELAARAAATAHNLVLGDELRSIHSAFEKARVPVVVLKGIPLMKRIGEDLGERRLADNDVLVRRRDVRRAAAALEATGYCELPGRSLDVSLRTGSGQHPMVREVHGHRVRAELHWEAFHPPFTGIAEERVWARTTTTKFGDLELCVPDAELTLVHTAAHYVWHAMGQPRLLRTLGRAWNAFRRDVDVASLEALATSLGVLPSLDFALTAAQELGVTESVPDFSTRQARAVRFLLPPDALSVRRPEPDYDRILVSLLLLSPERALRHVVRLAAPGPTQVGVVVGAPHPGRVAWHYVARPGRMLRRYLEYRRSV